MPITPRQKDLIQTSFSRVVPIADTAAEIFYAKLFEYDPSLKPLFKGDMKKQGQMLMTTLNAAVKGLGDLDTLVPILQKIAIKHLDYGVKIDDYTPVGNALIFTLEKGLGDDFDQDTKQAWKTLYHAIADIMRAAAYPEYDKATYVNRKSYHH